MDPILRRMSVFARMLAMMVASLLLSQFALAGAPTAAEAGFGVACTPGASGGGQPLAPYAGSHHGLCCILHCGALDAPPLKPHASIESPAGSVAKLDAFPAPASARRIGSKGAPQSPRAPPFATSTLLA